MGYSSFDLVIPRFTGWFQLLLGSILVFPGFYKVGSGVSWLLSGLPSFFFLPSFAELQLVPFFFSPPLHFKLRTSLRAIFFFVGRWDRRRRDGRWEEEEEEGEGASSGVGAAN